MSLFQRESGENVRVEDVRVDLFICERKRESKVFGLCKGRGGREVGNGGTIYKNGENWGRSSFVGGSVGRKLKITLSHPRKAEKKQVSIGF